MGGKSGAGGSALATTLAAAAGTVAAVAGLLALIGWARDLPLLASLLPGRVAMNPATALCFILSGISLWLVRNEDGSPAPRRVGQLCALLVAFVGLTRLIGYLGWDLGLDRLLFREQLDAVTPPNRMAPNTAATFVLMGLALALL